jgi:hypothetical protein
MLTELHQDCAMTPDTQASLSGDLSDAAAFLQAFAAAPDWQDCIDALWMTLPHVLPGIRVDIYAAEPADLATLLFSSSERPVISPALASVTDAQICAWLEREGYGVIMTLPLIGAGRRCGWLALARSGGSLAPQALALARQLAPLIALRLVCEQSNAALGQQRSKVAELEHQIGVTSTLRVRAMLAVGTAHNIGNLFTNVLGHAQLLEQDVPALFQPDVRVIIRAVDDGRQQALLLLFRATFRNQGPSQQHRREIRLGRKTAAELLHQDRDFGGPVHKFQRGCAGRKNPGIEASNTLRRDAATARRELR